MLAICFLFIEISGDNQSEEEPTDNDFDKTPKDILYTLNRNWESYEKVGYLYFVLNLCVIILIITLLSICLLCEHWGKDKLNKANHKAWVTIVAAEEEARSMKAELETKEGTSITTESNLTTTLNEEPSCNTSNYVAI
uniref:Ion_trans domain-containing protein n=1 Tax=Parastrongyloides trichosuri TaxID=131310 RepID=A0A0N4ZLJ5_PARTI